MNKHMGSAIAWIALAVIALMVLGAVFAPVLAPYGPNEQNIMVRLKGPMYKADGVPLNLLGTDELGRDILSRLIYGSRSSIMVGILTALFSGGIGVVAGLCSGYFKKVDAVVMRLADIQLAFPSMLLALAFVAVIGGGFWNLIIILGITGWVSFSRVVRSEVLSLKSSDYILAARTCGIGHFRILWRHILPNVIAPMLTIFTSQVASAIISEASLSFLGLGIAPTTPTWGNMLHSGQLYMANAWWMSLFPGICIMLIVLSINILGDVIRDYFDPKTRQS